MDDRKYLNKDIALITGVSPRQIISWTEKGLIVPLKEAKHTGTKREYDSTNIIEFAICNILLNYGFGFRAVKKMMQSLREQRVLVSAISTGADILFYSFENKGWTPHIQNNGLIINIKNIVNELGAYKIGGDA